MFSWFRDICFDDPGKLLALSSAIALAQPYETLILLGDIVMRADITLELGREGCPALLAVGRRLPP